MKNLREMIDDSTERLLRKVDEISIGNLADVISDEKEENYKKEIERLQKQLDIAIKALRGVYVWANTGNGGEQAVKKLCDKALKEIEELN